MPYSCVLFGASILLRVFFLMMIGDNLPVFSPSNANFQLPLVRLEYYVCLTIQIFYLKSTDEYRYGQTILMAWRRLMQNLSLLLIWLD